MVCSLSTLVSRLSTLDSRPVSLLPSQISSPPVQAFHVIRDKIIVHGELPAAFDFMRYLKKCFGVHKEEAVHIETHTWIVAGLILLLNALRVEFLKPLYKVELDAAQSRVCGLVGWGGGGGMQCDIRCNAVRHSG